MRYVKRKWGYYITLLDRKHFKMKLLRFKKGGSLSIQKHYLRNELWVFLTGDHEGNYYHIPVGEYHTYHAQKKTWVLEVQYGDYCLEHDIVRVE